MKPLTIFIFLLTSCTPPPLITSGQIKSKQATPSGWTITIFRQDGHGGLISRAVVVPVENWDSCEVGDYIDLVGAGGG
jgi:hypothetical protein